MAILTETVSPAHSTTSVCFKVTFYNFYDTNERYSALNSKTVWLDDLTQWRNGTQETGKRDPGNRGTSYGEPGNGTWGTGERDRGNVTRERGFGEGIK